MFCATYAMEIAQTSVFLSTWSRIDLLLATAAVLTDMPSMPLISALVSETRQRQRICLSAPRIGSGVTMDDAFHLITSAMVMTIALTRAMNVIAQARICLLMYTYNGTSHVFFNIIQI